MVKGLGNRQLVKNPRKRDRYAAARKAPPQAPSPKQRREQLQRLKRIPGGGTEE